tara:strand:- start:220 stop:429 length:210 start_codon:yes stop_codon:yes gene_type:complete
MPNVAHETLTRDIIRAMSEQEIRQLMIQYKSQLFEQGSKYLSVKNLEMDYCYLQRELQTREKWGSNRQR